MPPAEVDAMLPIHVNKVDAMLPIHSIYLLCVRALSLYHHTTITTTTTTTLSSPH
jgi:hypothetical protein